MPAAIKLPYASARPGPTTNTTIDEQISAIPSIQWFTSDAAYLTQVSGKVSAFASRSGSSPVLGQATAGKRGTLTQRSGEHYPSVELTGLADESYQLASGDPDWSAPWTVVMIWREDNPGADNAALWGVWEDSNKQTVVSRDSNQAMVFRHGNGVNSGLIIVPNNYGAWRFGIFAFDGVKIMMEVDGVRYGDSTVISNQNTAGLLSVGALWNSPAFSLHGGFKEFFVMPSNVFAVTGQADLFRSFAAMHRCYGY
jgi:hypothetical protein